MKKITIVGAGYVGLSLAVLLAKKNSVTLIDIDESKISKLNNGNSTLAETSIQDMLTENFRNLSFKTNFNSDEADFYIIATSTNYDPEKQFFDTNSVEKVIKKIKTQFNTAKIAIKSTIPVGFTESMQTAYNCSNIFFSPEFLREGTSVEDNINPSRIVIGNQDDVGKNFGNLLAEITENNPPQIFMDSKTAEAVKLFSNSYLAMRVSYFNELDSFAFDKKLNPKKLIEAVCLDDRIGSSYNNPSFGYGGYCLPKDSKQLLANYKNVPQNLISAVVKANSTRKDFISDQIIALKPKSVGIYRLVMKSGSDNFRESAVQGIMKRLNAKNIKMFIYEPEMTEKTFFGCKVLNNFNEFCDHAEVIVANRHSKQLEAVKNKVFTRDIFQNN